MSAHWGRSIIFEQEARRRRQLHARRLHRSDAFIGRNAKLFVACGVKDKMNGLVPCLIAIEVQRFDEKLVGPATGFHPLPTRKERCFISRGNKVVRCAQKVAGGVIVRKNVSLGPKRAPVQRYMTVAFGMRIKCCCPWFGLGRAYQNLVERLQLHHTALCQKSVCGAIHCVCNARVDYRKECTCTTVSTDPIERITAQCLRFAFTVNTFTNIFHAVARAVLRWGCSGARRIGPFMGSPIKNSSQLCAASSEALPMFTQKSWLTTAFSQGLGCGCDCDAFYQAAKKHTTD